MSGSKADKIETPTLIVRENSDDKNRILIQKFKLLVVSGPLQGEEFAVQKDRFTIGSGPDNDLELKDTTVSRRHCEIELTQEGYLIRDNGSTNGTLIHGVRVSEAYLDRGTEFRMGNTRIIFCPMQGALEYALSPNTSFGRVLGQSVAMRRVFYLCETYASTDINILIEGETGTGKEILAEEIHRHSKRKDGPFVVVDCASLAKELIASELFGHTKGSFTGAIGDRVGAFEHANGGTIFLDEIGELQPELQPVLLRVLEKREIRRTGCNQVRHVDVRIICATNRKLESEVRTGRFREDLFFRLSVVRVEVPPLRQRKTDIAMLAEKFLSDFYGPNAMQEIVEFDKAVEAFKNYEWPGNVRELRNVIEMAAYSERRPMDLTTFLYLNRMPHPSEKPATEFSADRPFKDAKNELIQNFEKDYIREILQRCGGNVSRAAREAGIERAYLQRLVAKYDLRNGANPSTATE